MNHLLDDVVKVYNENFNEKDKVVWEVGSRDGLDGYEVAIRIGVDEFKNLYFVEANAAQGMKIKEFFPHSTTFITAVSNFEGDADFVLYSRANGDMGAVGCSSLRTDWLDEDIKTDPSIRKEMTHVKVTKLANLIEHTGVEKIDVMLIDVEGVAYEVLEGMGDHINKVKVFQIETELNSSTDKIIEYLTGKGFELYPNKPHWTGHPDVIMINRN